MRLSPDEVAAIRACVTRHFGAEAVVRLFGSRLDDRRSGGDIDLHVVTPDPALATIDVELEFLVDLKDRIGDRKIDVVVRHEGDTGRLVDLVALSRGVILS